MKSKLPVASRVLLALFVIVFGLNKFLNFMPMPDPPEEGGKYLGALNAAGFIFPTLGVLYIGSGVMLALSRAVGLALVLLSPLAINAALYHLRYDPAGVGGAAVFCILIAFCAWFHRDCFKSLFQ